MITRNMMAGGSGASAVFEFKYTVTTNASGSSDKKSALPINLYGQTGVEISVDWGDGSTSVLKPADYTASSSLASVHEYASAGTYQITASSSNWSNAYLLSCYADAPISSANNANQPVYWWRRTLKSVDSPLPPVKGVMRLASASATSMTASNNDLGFLFHRCEKMTSIPANLFENAGHIEEFNSTFYNCIVLPSIPAGLFDPCVSALNFSDCFRYCLALTSIPVSFFKYCTAATNMYNVFRFCNKVPSVPADLFRYNTLVTNLGGAFSKCDALKNFTLCIGSSSVDTVSDFIPNASNVTRIVCVPANSTTYTSFNAYKNTSNNVTVSTSNVDCGIEEEEIDGEYWQFTVSMGTGQYDNKKAGIPFNLYGQTGIQLTVDWGDGSTSTLTPSDYTEANSSASVHVYSVGGEHTIKVYSNDWENTYLLGVDGNSSNFTLSNTNAPIYWFRETLISVDNAIPQVKGIKHYSMETSTVTGTTLTTYVNSLNALFQKCSNLASIPSDLFANNTAVTDFGYCFQWCGHLASIPAGLFDNNTMATNFISCFHQSGVASIPVGLFDNNTAATSFEGCFFRTSIASIPTGLFDNNTAVTTFRRCFDSCTSLASIPSGLFAKNTAVTSLAGCFNACSSLRNFHLKIGSSYVAEFNDSSISTVVFIPSTINVDRILCVPANSTTYTNASNFANASNGVIVSTDFIECSEAWEFTIDTEATAAGEKKTAIPVNLYGQTGIELLVDWGDNTTSTLTPSNYTQADSRASVHTYAAAGEYTVTIYSNDWANTYFLNVENYFSDDTDNISAIYWFSRTLKTVDSILPKIKGMKLYASYSSNTLTTEDDSVKWLFHFARKLISIPSGFFDNNTQITNFSYCFFGCSSLASIPSGLFDNNTLATGFGATFDGCTSIASIPSGLFDNNTEVTGFGHCFAQTSITTVPTGLFDKNTKVTTFGGCFSACSSLASIPSGLFDKNVNVNYIESCFHKCSSLASIPAGLFDKNTQITSFYCCFFECSSLTSIPSGLFDKNTKVTTFNRCFEGCSKLASIPSGLFDKNVNVTEFESCFYKCSKLASIPDALFSKNTKVTSFDTTFRECTTLSTIPSGLFDNNTKVTTFEQCFYGCTHLTSIPLNLFKYNTLVTNLSYCFLSCTNLLNFHLIIGSANVSSFTSFVSNASNVDRLLCVPANSTTYTKASSYANSSNNVIVSTDLTDCVDTWEFTIDTEATASGEKKTSIPFNLYGQTGVEMTVDWGDDTATTLTPSNYASNDSTASVHEYATAGTYTVTIVCNNWSNTYLYNHEAQVIPSLSNANAAAYWFRRTLIYINERLPLIKGTKRTTYNSPNSATAHDNDLGYCFIGCTALSFIRSGLFDKNTAATSFSNCFNKCTSISSIPSGLFDKNTAATTFLSCFSYDSSLYSIPAGLFDKNVNVTTFKWCFHRCTSIRAIPAGLFDKNTKATDFSICFAYCSSLATIPAGLFDKNTRATTFYMCFYECAVTTISIGLFRKNTAVTTFYNCFGNCTSLLNFHLIIGSSSVSSFDGFIPNASNVDRLLCVPADSTTYTNATAMANASNGVVVSTDVMDCVETWEFTINTEATASGEKKTGIPFNLYGQDGIKLLVDWGDNTTSTLLPSDYANDNCTASVHEYAVAGEYTVTIACNDWENAYLLVWKYGEIASEANKHAALYRFRRTVTSIDTKLPKVKGVKTYQSLYATALTTYDNTLESLFGRANKLVSIPSGLFDNNTAVTSFAGCFSGCSSLQSIPSRGVFNNNTAVTTFSSCFYGCSSIRSIPSRLFASSTAATTFDWCFYGCESLTSIPSGLFYYNTAATNFSDCFNDCYSLASIPEELFYRNTAATTFKRCMKNCAMTSIPADMFGNKPSATDFELCFTGCENLVSLPDGLFDGCTAATTFSDCFFGCYALSSIPSRLFYKTTAITNLTNCFYSCENLLNFHLIIGSPYVDAFDGFVDNINTYGEYEDVERILCVPDNSLTYTRATNNLASNDNKIIVSTDITDCLETWEITIDTEASEEGAKTTGIPFNLAAGYQPTYNITLYVDWGDGNASVLTSNDYLSKGSFTTKVVSTASVHEYAVPGQYQITIAATDWKHVEMIEYPSTFLDITAPDDFNIALYWFKKTLITIDKPLPTVYRYGICKTIGYSSESRMYGFEGLFAECRHLQAIPSDLFINNPSVTDFSYCFKDCRAVPSIPENLFALHTGVTTFMCTFSGCTSLTTIPTNLFANNVSVKTFQLCFYNDESILNFEINIGSGIVSNCYAFIPKNTNATQRIVNVPRSSTTYTTFNNKAADLGITVVGV